MTHTNYGPPKKLSYRLTVKSLRICAGIFLVCVMVYAVTIADLFQGTNESMGSWNFSILLENTVSNLENAIKMPKPKIRERRLVLLWTTYFQQPNWLPSTKYLHCPVSECDVTSNRSLLLNSSAVIFHWRSTNTTDLPKCNSSETVHCPIWVLLNREAPPHSPISVLKDVQDRLHWTVTYRRDSDIFAPYGKIVPKKTRSSAKSDFNYNRRLVCWLVSNCNTPSKREVFVNELKKYIDVDIYGKCGTMQCPLNSNIDCYFWLSERCMFYLSLENSKCKDYTTEKLYKALSTNMVPIVMGDISNYNHLPSHSVINASQFSDPKDLANYLMKVGKDANLYQSYFTWKRNYEVQQQHHLWYCDLCRKLHDTNLEAVKSGRDLVSWWFNESICENR